MFVLALVGLFAVITGCEKQAAKQPAATPEQPAMTATEQPKPVAPAPTPAPVKTAEPAKPAAEKPSGPGPYGFVANFEDEPGFIVNWLVIGPFPNPGDRPDNAGFNTDYLGGEADYTPANGMEVKDPCGTILKWQPYQSGDALVNFFDIPFLKLEQGQEDILCYCACWVESDDDKDVEVRVGSDDGYKLWINHKEVGIVHEYRSSGVDQETYKVKLNKGKNLVLIKVDQDYGEFEFLLRIVNAEGKPVEGLKVWLQQ
jgi:hypothetical protein